MSMPVPMSTRRFVSIHEVEIADPHIYFGFYASIQGPISILAFFIGSVTPNIVSAGSMTTSILMLNIIQNWLVEKVASNSLWTNTLLVSTKAI